MPIKVALGAGVIAITCNMLALWFADSVHLVTARGGLLQLIVRYAGPPLSKTSLVLDWTRAGLYGPSSPIFQYSFHVLVGLGMAVFYSLVQARIPGSPLQKGFWYGALVWIMNAVVVLPLIGQGFAGDRIISPLGMVYFAAAHVLFFEVLAVVYSRLSPS